MPSAFKDSSAPDSLLLRRSGPAAPPPRAATGVVAPPAVTTSAADTRAATDAAVLGAGSAAGRDAVVSDVATALAVHAEVLALLPPEAAPLADMGRALAASAEALPPQAAVILMPVLSDFRQQALSLIGASTDIASRTAPVAAFASFLQTLTPEELTSAVSGLKLGLSAQEAALTATATQEALLHQDVAVGYKTLLPTLAQLCTLIGTRHPARWQALGQAMPSGLEEVQALFLSQSRASFEQYADAVAQALAAHASVGSQAARTRADGQKLQAISLYLAAAQQMASSGALKDPASILKYVRGQSSVLAPAINLLLKKAEAAAARAVGLRRQKPNTVKSPFGAVNIPLPPETTSPSTTGAAGGGSSGGPDDLSALPEYSVPFVDPV